MIALVVVHYQHTQPHILTFSIPELTEGLTHLDWGDWNQTHTWGDWGDGKVFWSSPQVVIFLLLCCRVRDQGADVPVPHLAPAGPRRGADGRLDPPGRRAAQGGELRFPPVQHGDDAARGAGALSVPDGDALAVIGILYGALAALAQTDVKRLVAYSSVSHMGFIILGMFSMNATGIDGGVIQMVNHGLTTGALFACVGVIYERYHTRRWPRWAGSGIGLPLWAFFLILAAMGSAALPGLNGFVGEFPILLGMFRTDRTLAVARDARHDPGGLLPAPDAPEGRLRPAQGADGPLGPSRPRRRDTVMRRSGPWAGMRSPA